MKNPRDELDRRDTPAPSKTTRRSFLTAAGSLTIGPTLSTTTQAVVSTGTPVVPDEFTGTEWSNPSNLGRDSRDGVIEWNGVRVRNKRLKQDAVQEEDAFENVPLWRLYAWRFNQLDTPPSVSTENKSKGTLSGILDGFSAAVPIGPVIVSANLGEIADVVAESDDYVSRVGTDVFADQMESDYPIEGEVEVCEGFREPGLIRCSSDEDNYSNSSADVPAKYSFEVDYDVGEGWFDPDVTYRALFVVQTYDTDVNSNLRKTFVVAGAVFPVEMSDVDVIGEYDFVDTSRQFMKNVR